MGPLSKFLILLLALVFIACTKPALEPSAYIHYLNSEKSGLLTTKTINKIKFKCKLQTPELITLQNSDVSHSNKQLFETEKQFHTKQLNVIFLIEDASKDDHLVKETVFREERYSQVLAYSGDGLQKDFAIQLPNGDIVPSSFVHMEPGNSINPVIRITVAFTNIDITGQDCSIVFDDVLFGTGKVKFHYDKSIFTALPTLKFKS